MHKVWVAGEVPGSGSRERFRGRGAKKRVKEEGRRKQGEGSRAKGVYLAEFAERGRRQGRAKGVGGGNEPKGVRPGNGQHGGTATNKGRHRAVVIVISAGRWQWRRS
jgi:hypothetical protein